jgi:hypothetical protein
MSGKKPVKEEASRVARWYIFKQKYQFGFILEGLGMEKVGIFMVI